MYTGTLVVSKSSDSILEFEAPTASVIDIVAAVRSDNTVAQVSLGDGVSVLVPGQIRVRFTPESVRKLKLGPGQYEVVTVTAGGSTPVARGSAAIIEGIVTIDRS